MAQVISTEARAFANGGHGGLTYFSPMVNIYRYVYAFMSCHKALHCIIEIHVGEEVKRCQEKV